MLSVRFIMQNSAQSKAEDSHSHDILMDASRACDEDTFYWAVKPRILAYLDAHEGTRVESIQLKYGPRDHYGPRGGVYKKSEIRAAFVRFSNGQSLWLRLCVKCVVVDSIILGEKGREAPSNK